MNTKVTLDTPNRNTNIKVRCWCFTINNPTQEDRDSLLKLICELDDYAWQDEKGENGTLHIQGYLYFKNARSFSSLQKLLPRAHLEKARKKFALKQYCQKDETCVGNKVCKNITCDDPLEGLETYSWQKEIIEITKEKPDHRTIYWYWETSGCAGKTTLAKHICLMDKRAIYLSGQAADMKYGVFKYVQDHGWGPSIIFIDVPRCVEKISFNGIEQIKNGIFYNTKYESGMVLYNNPHVIIFANESPSSYLDLLSKDRWDIRQIIGDESMKCDTPSEQNNWEDDFEGDLP